VHWLDFNIRILLLEMHGTNIKKRTNCSLSIIQKRMYKETKKVRRIMNTAQRIALTNIEGPTRNAETATFQSRPVDSIPVFQQECRTLQNNHAKTGKPKVITIRKSDVSDAVHSSLINSFSKTRRRCVCVVN
jgi:hypothetical protein